MIHFVGAGPGAVDLITVRGLELLKKAGIIVYAGSLVNPELLKNAPPECVIRDSAAMTLEEVIDVLADGQERGCVTVRLHTGDPCLYGAIREQMDRLSDMGIGYEVVPGVSSFCAAAAAIGAEYTLPGVSQSLIITRMEGRTPVPERESVRKMASHGTSMVYFLSSGMVGGLCGELIAGGYTSDTKAVMVYKASWPDQKVVAGTLSTLPELAESAGIRNTALVLVGDFLGSTYERSKLYDPAFAHGYREAK